MQFHVSGVADVQPQDGLTWIDALPAKTWHTKKYGPVEVSEPKLLNFVKNFKNNVRGIEIATDYEHGLDTSKGTKASGWIRDMVVDSTGLVPTLRLGMEFTDPAKQEIKNKEWRYFSLEWEDDYLDTATGNKHTDVVTGGGLTNRPVIKGQAPINFSELDDTADVIESLYELAVISEDDAARLDALTEITELTGLEFADWSTAYKNSLPDSAFMYVSGKTRMFPYKDKTGKVDHAHLVAITRLAPRAGVSQDIIDRVVAKAKRLLGNSMSEGGDELNLLEQMRVALGLDAETDEAAVITAFSEYCESHKTLENNHKQLSEELEPLRKLKEDIGGRKKFADEYPEEFKRMTDLEHSNRRMEAKSFSEAYKATRFNDITVTEEKDENGKPKTKVTATTKGLSGLAIQQIEDTANKFADGTVQLSDFKDTLDAIVSGVVDYGQTGTEVGVEPTGPTLPSGNVSEIRKQFSDKVFEVMAKDELDTDAAIKHVAELNPELWEAYKNPAMFSSR